MPAHHSGASRSPSAKPRLAAAVEAARDRRSWSCPTGSMLIPGCAYEEELATAPRSRRRSAAMATGSGGRPAACATAVRAVRGGGGAATRPRVGIFAEYDALPGLGHGCGHNLMAASGVGAAIGLAAVIDGEWPVPGSCSWAPRPRSAATASKRSMIEDGLFADLDAALLFHPSDRSHAEKHALASEEIDVVFHRLAGPCGGRGRGRGGTRSTRLIVLFRARSDSGGSSSSRTARVHGIIVEGGTAPNIIPARRRPAS